jgi:two-component system, LuxR family, response regulator FixJ
MLLCSAATKGTAFMPNVYIVDDDVMAGRLLGQVLSAAGFAARSFASAQDFLDAAPWLAPGCLVADVRMPGIDGLELLRRLTERAMPFPAVMISGYADIPMAVRAIKIGAVEFVEKPFSEETILGSIARAQDRLARSGEETDAARARLALLTEREREVLEGLVAGLPNKTLAYDLGISVRTVEGYRARVMEKMQARNLSHLVRLALVAGIEIAS